MSYVIYQVSSCYGIPSHQSSNLWASKCLIGFNLDNSIRINEPYHNWNCSNNHCFIFLFNNIKSPECILLHWRIIIYCPEHWTTPTYYLELCNELTNKENRRDHFPVSLLFFVRDHLGNLVPGSDCKGCQAGHFKPSHMFQFTLSLRLLINLRPRN